MMLRLILQSFVWEVGHLASTGKKSYSATLLVVIDHNDIE